MNPQALTICIITHILVTGIVVYLYWKVLKSPPKPEPDSYTDNDPK